MQRKTILRRVGRAGPPTTRRSPSLWEITEGLPPSPLERAERARREAEAKEEAEKAAAASAPTEAKAEAADMKPAEAQPPAPQTPPPEPQWWEEKCRWRPRGEADRYDDGDGMEYCETIHRYDPFERALEEEDYDPDDYLLRCDFGECLIKTCGGFECASSAHGVDNAHFLTRFVLKIKLNKIAAKVPFRTGGL